MKLRQASTPGVSLSQTTVNVMCELSIGVLLLAVFPLVFFFLMSCPLSPDIFPPLACKKMV
jgi:hypothetical protein